MTDRFDLEQQIFDCWMVTSDLDTLFEDIMENSDISKDTIANILLGMSQLYEIKFNKTFRTFEQLIKQRAFSDQNATDEQRAVQLLVEQTAAKYVEDLELPPPVTTKAKKKAKK